MAHSARWWNSHNQLDSRSNDHVPGEETLPFLLKANGFDRHVSDSRSVSDGESSGSETSHKALFHHSWRAPPSTNDSKQRPARQRNVVHYLCLALFTTLIIFIASLIRASHVASKQLELGLVQKAPPPKPPWEEFPFLHRYTGGLRSLTARNKSWVEYPNDDSIEVDGNLEQISNRLRNESDIPTAQIFHPETDSGNQDGRDSQKLQVYECFLDAAQTIRPTPITYHSGSILGLPDPVIGSHENLGLTNEICLDRYDRLRAYGYGLSAQRHDTDSGLDPASPANVTESANVTGSILNRRYSNSSFDFRKIRWADAQRQCFSRNSHRFQKLEPRAKPQVRRDLTDRPDIEQSERNQGSEASQQSNGTSVNYEPMPIGHLPRIALVIRTWSSRQYTAEDILYLRSLVAELAIASSGEYTVHFLVQVKDEGIPIWADQQIYDRVLNNSLPAEFAGMGSLWTEKQMAVIYPSLDETLFRDLPVHGVYRGAFMALQHFSQQNPEYDFVWNWEMDIRSTGHWYDLFQKVSHWAGRQPRKGLWERNARFYIPSVHGSWDDFRQMCRVQSELLQAGGRAGSSGSSGKLTSSLLQGIPPIENEAPIWGPHGPPDILQAQEDPEAPKVTDKLAASWGVGEEADLITLSPIFNPEGTTWFYDKDITGYNTTAGLPPRRASIGTATRLSRKLLQTMHRETILARHHMFTEMWPASVALHHGYKAVYVPHPVYIDRRWPTRYLADVLNGGRDGASGGARTSVYGGREHNFKGQTWFYDAGFAPNLWRRWLGLVVDNDGGAEAEEAGEGRMCLPPMLFHPVKGVDLEEGKMDP